MSGYDSAGIPHLFGYVSERADKHSNRRNAFCLRSSGYVPDRHVTYRSDGYQKEGLDPGRFPPGDPAIELVVETTLRTDTDEGICN